MPTKLSEETRSMLKILKKRWELSSFDKVIKRMTKQTLAISDELIELHSETHTDEKERRAEIKAINFLRKKKCAFQHEIDNFIERNVICAIAKQWNMIKLSIEAEDLRKSDAKQLASLLLINRKAGIKLWRDSYLARYVPILLDADEDEVKQLMVKVNKRIGRGRPDRLTEAKTIMLQSRLKTIFEMRKKLLEWDRQVSLF